MSEPQPAMTYLTLQEAASMLKVSYRTICKWRDAGLINAKKLGPGRRAPWRVSDHDLHAFVERNGK